MSFLLASNYATTRNHQSDPPRFSHHRGQRYRHACARLALSRRRPARRGKSERSIFTSPATFRAEGQIVHFHFHGGRPQPDGSLRSEAKAQRIERTETPRVAHKGNAVRLHPEGI